MKNKFSLLKKAVVGLFSATTLIFTSQAGAVIITYDNQTAFLNDNTGLTLENFDTFFSPTNSASFDSGFTASRPGTDTMFSTANSNLVVSGRALTLNQSLSASPLSFTFDEAIYSYGVTIIDAGTLSNVSYDLVVSNDEGFSQTVASFPPTLSQGNQLFFGISSDVAFNTITWSSSFPNGDQIGWDNMYFGTNAVVPEPSTYAMFGLAVAMLGFMGYRSRNRKR